MRAHEATASPHEPIARLRAVASVLVGMTLLAGVACARLGAATGQQEGEVGAIRPGMLANLVILDGDPLADLANLSHAWRVVKDGRFFDPHELVASLD